MKKSIVVALARCVSGFGRRTRHSLQTSSIEDGLTVILLRTIPAPTYSIALSYNVGSRDEKSDAPALAHLFEHMMSKVRKNVAKGEHPSLISTNGGR